VVVAAAVAGCGDVDRAPPPSPVVALALGQEVATVDAQLIGVARAMKDATTLKANRDLWSRARRIEEDIPSRLDTREAGGMDLVTAAHAARSAAVALRSPRPDETAAIHLLSASAAALRQAADALTPYLPPSDASRLERMRNPLPPGSEQA
jgi:hypothetical protein